MINTERICKLIVLSGLLLFTPSVFARAPLYLKGEWKLTLNENEFTMTIDQQTGEGFSGYLNNGDLIVDGKVTDMVITFTRKPSEKTASDWPRDEAAGSDIREQHIKITLTEYVTYGKWGLFFGTGTWDGYHANGAKLEARVDQKKQSASNRGKSLDGSLSVIRPTAAPPDQTCKNERSWYFTDDTYFSSSLTR
jgi:hypothetical protein